MSGSDRNWAGSLKTLNLRGLSPGRAAEAGRWERVGRKLERPVAAAPLHLPPAV